MTTLTHAGADVADAVEMRDPETTTPPAVWLGDTAFDSIAVSVYVLVRDGARRRPELAAAMRGSVRLRFTDDYPAVRIAFGGGEIEVADDLVGDDASCDLEISGRLGDITALIVAPLTRGLPNPATRTGRQAIIRLADRRITVDGPLVLARDLLRLLTVDAERDATRRAA